MMLRFSGKKRLPFRGAAFLLFSFQGIDMAAVADGVSGLLRRVYTLSKLIFMTHVKVFWSITVIITTKIDD